jgi:hypothetical protein
MLTTYVSIILEYEAVWLFNLFPTFRKKLLCLDHSTEGHRTLEDGDVLFLEKAENRLSCDDV